MADLRALVVGLLAGFSLTAHAGYAQLAAPAGFSVSGGGFGYAASANDAVFGRVIHQPGALTANVDGQAVKMPAAYRLAANAPRIAAQAIFLHPGIRTAAGIALWLGAAKLSWDALQGKWVINDHSQYPISDGLEYAFDNDALTGWKKTKLEACTALKDYFHSVGSNRQLTGIEDMKCVFDDNQKYDLKERGSDCPVGWYITPAGCVQTPQPRKIEDLEEFQRRILNPDNQPGWPMPDSVPLELPPGTALPVEQPFINPAPGPNPAHRPQFVPTGNPVPNPSYDPNSPVGPANQPYLQPGVRIVPSPTPSNPWQVDMQPVDRPVGSAEPNSQPQPDPEPGDGDKPKPEEQQSLCEKHPDIVACQKLGDVQPEALASKTVPVSIQREDGFGPADGACPAPKEFVILGKQMAFRWDLICDFASGIRPLLVGFAYLSAALAFLGLSRKEV